MHAALLALAASLATATSSGSQSTPFGGNGHNLTFDGRVFIVRQGPDTAEGGWMAYVLRPERITQDQDGFPRFDEGAFTAPVLVQPVEACENALAICQRDAARAPYPCDEGGAAAAAGPFACYDLVIIDSNACGNGAPNDLQRRALQLWVAQPGTADASIHKWAWGGAREPMVKQGGGAMNGIEPTVTRDGKLLVWQGHHDNDGKIDLLMYATNEDPCGLSGWDGPHPLAHMANDLNVHGRYPLGERQLKAADGDAFDDERSLLGGLIQEPADEFHGAYPWLFPDGEAVSFTSVVVPCRSENDPAGCGPRRGGFAVIGYPTNWGVAHIDGAVNPTTEDQVRLFFSSPGPLAFPQIPVTPGVDVWPFFGSDTQNYVELTFDDGLDGRYAGVWHMNESVTKGGELDRTKTPDTSGYFNTGLVEGGAVFPAVNNAAQGKGVVLNGASGRVRVPHASSLSPVNALTLEVVLRPDASPDCGAGDNRRVMVAKGTAYSLTLEEDLTLTGRVRAGGAERALHAATPIPVGTFSAVAFTYRGATGEAVLFIDGVERARIAGAPGVLDAETADLLIGGPPSSVASCADAPGAFAGIIDEVRLSRIDRFGPPGSDDVPVQDAGSAASDAGTAADAGAPSSTDAGSSSDAGSDGAVQPGDDDEGVGVLPEAPTFDGGAGGDEDEAPACACAAPTTSRPIAAIAALLGGAAFVRRRRRG